VQHETTSTDPFAGAGPDGTKQRTRALLVDGGVNVALGVALLCFRPLAGWFGAPPSDTAFYPTILGGVLFGVGIALFVEARRGPNALVGLGLGGAIAINLCGGTVLTAWLIAGDLDLPLRGLVFLWGLAIILVGISAIELLIHFRSGRRYPQ